MGVLNTDQVHALFYDGKNGKRLAQKKLQRLYEAKQLRRVRVAINQPYVYYTGKKPGQLEHLVSLNWVYIWLKNQIKGWGELHCFNREQDYKVLRTDAFAGIKDRKNGFYFLFIEMDIAESGNEFKKVQLYNMLYEKELYSSWWWVNMATGFPPIVVVTTGSKEKILRRIEPENTNNLEFRVYTLDEIKKGCE